MRSLRVRLFLLLGSAIVAAALLQFTASVRAAMQQANKLFDYHMQQIALALQDSDFQNDRFYTPQSAGNNNFDFVIQIWTDDGVRVYQSRTYRYLPQQGVLGYSTVTLGNGDWRIYVVKAEKRVIQVAQKLETRRDRAISLALHSVWPVLPVSLLLFIAAWWVVTSALQPLNRIGYELANRRTDSLDPVSDKGVPHEVSLLVGELNSLLVRMARTLRSQQHFVADAAHELRSPLTALKLQLQTLARAKDSPSRTQAITRLEGGVDRASRLVEQLLVLARQDPNTETGPLVEVVLINCADQAVADVMPFASVKNVEIKYEQRTSISVSGDSESLRVMIRNVLDNAVRYTPEYGQVSIGVASNDTHVVVTVQDSGVGIYMHDRERVFDRFYRVPGTSPSGSGLGLAIVKAIAERHQATVSLCDSILGGLGVAISFPRHQIDAS